MISTACNRGMICPAFQSSFILNDSIRDITFSVLGPDSLPRGYLTAKNRHGVIEGTPYYYKKESLRTVEMVTIYDPMFPMDSTLTTPTYQEDSLRFADPQISSTAVK
ncbi:hypothetical protein [Catalinimonas niigatensis]|uniref:hypothetical protein n=1 Tax=Catalinimonas niigatensis TaxID=1397264 RepID=UPI0026669F30|nr:hypothetical protein [Catalinimonas niigatensis]WPP51270.1 hypothetical protein PZB72_02555 [Catalinimonas niigatensis]